jgi:hypothetical protein
VEKAKGGWRRQKAKGKRQKAKMSDKTQEKGTNFTSVL